MENLKEQYKNPIFIEMIVNGMESPKDIAKIGETNKFFYKNITQNNLVWYYAMKKWYPNHISSSQPYNFHKDYRRNFALQMGIILAR